MIARIEWMLAEIYFSRLLVQ